MKLYKVKVIRTSRVVETSTFITEAKYPGNARDRFLDLVANDPGFVPEFKEEGSEVVQIEYNVTEVK